MNLPTPDALQVVLTAMTLAGLWIGWAKVVGPPVKRGCNWVMDMVAVFIGRRARVDRVTGETHRKVPSLIDALVQIHDKQAEQGKSIDNLTVLMTEVADQQVTLSEHTRQIADLRLASALNTEQIGLLKTAAGERTEMHRETTALLNTIAERDTITGETD